MKMLPNEQSVIFY